MASSRSLNVIALISGGKDSMYSILHCISQGHSIVALANLAPEQAAKAPEQSVPEGDAPLEQDLNSFMYQTAGHTLIPLYQECIPSVPLYREAITGNAKTHLREYGFVDGDETESIYALLARIKQAHPEANAVCSGAILSTYQRTRVESVAIRLGLQPLSLLWQYPQLPFQPSSSGISSSSAEQRDPAALLRDMATIGMDVRIIKVASGGLDDSFLWANLCEERTIGRVQRAMDRFGGSVLGEGGEYETFVLKGPAPLWKRRIVVEEDQMHVVKGEAMESWLSFTGGRTEETETNVLGRSNSISVPRRPELFDERFRVIREDLMKRVQEISTTIRMARIKSFESNIPQNLISDIASRIEYGGVHNLGTLSTEESVHEQTRLVCARLAIATSKDQDSTIHTIILLRRMSDFAAFNQAYGPYFSKAPLPPSRVTVACGELMPPGVDVLLSAVRSGHREETRQGLHVQSRSFWAPANIGPYSQARALTIDVPREEEQRDRVVEAEHVYIAGQIPLVPESMELWQAATPEEDKSLAAFSTRAVLALQHLWRVGIEQKVGFWTGAVAYIAPSEDDFASRAWLARLAWQSANEDPSTSKSKTMSDEDEDEAEDENFDVWHQANASTRPSWLPPASAMGEGEAQVPLPDWKRVLRHARPYLTGESKGSQLESHPLPFIAVEVAELPRGADIEWQAHGFRLNVERLKYSIEQKILAKSVHKDSDTAWLTSSVIRLVSSTSSSGVGIGTEMEQEYAKVTVLELTEIDASPESSEQVQTQAQAQEQEQEEALLTALAILKANSSATVTVYATGQYERWFPTDDSSELIMTDNVPCLIPCRRIIGSERRALRAGVILREGC